MNQPAFPQNTKYMAANGAIQFEGPQGGLSMRDYFAAKAMQGMYASHNFPSGVMIDTAKEAYEMADAMMKAREA